MALFPSIFQLLFLAQEIFAFHKLAAEELFKEFGPLARSHGGGGGGEGGGGVNGARLLGAHFSVLLVSMARL